MVAQVFGEKPNAVSGWPCATASKRAHVIGWRLVTGGHDTQRVEIGMPIRLAHAQNSYYESDWSPKMPTSFFERAIGKPAVGL